MFFGERGKDANVDHRSSEGECFEFFFWVKKAAEKGFILYEKGKNKNQRGTTLCNYNRAGCCYTTKIQDIHLFLDSVLYKR